MILLKNIGKHEFDLFHEMALEYFRELDNNFYPTDKWESFIEGCIKLPKISNTFSLGVYLKNELIGFFILETNSLNLSGTKRCKLMHFFIVKENRKKGYGSLALNNLKTMVKKNDVKELEIEVMVNNLEAFNFWKNKHSFKPHSQKLRYKVL